ncbi:hypothetical protein [Actinomadura vinacea]
MNTDGQRLDHDTAERLLDGVPFDPDLRADGLADLLAAASGPAREGELAGEDAAVAAFRAAAFRRAAAPPARSWFRFARLAPVKIAAVAVATATAAGGMVLAGGAMGLPIGPLSSHTDSPQSPVPVDGPKASASPQARPGVKTTTEAPGPSRSTLVALCRAYGAIAPSRRAQELAKPSLRMLVNAAGGVSKVPGYCAWLAPSSQKSQRQDGSSTGEGSDPKKGKGNGSSNGKGKNSQGGEDDADDEHQGNGPRPTRDGTGDGTQDGPGGNVNDYVNGDSSRGGEEQPTTSPTPTPTTPQPTQSPTP